jgi:hypothetical protein
VLQFHLAASITEYKSHAHGSGHTASHGFLRDGLGNDKLFNAAPDVPILILGGYERLDTVTIGQGKREQNSGNPFPAQALEVLGKGFRARRFPSQSNASPCRSSPGDFGGIKNEINSRVAGSLRVELRPQVVLTGRKNIFGAD